MKYINTFNEFEILLEKSIGSEAIRAKYYSNMNKADFYKIVNLDPTSIRKKEFSKPGKYTKWLLQQAKPYLNDSDRYMFDFQFNKRLNYYLFIFSTNWAKGKTKYNDILKYSSLYDFTSDISKLEDKYKVQTENAKYDSIYSDDKVDILIPLNFTASYETSKNTEWCSQQASGYSDWNQRAVLYRILPKNENYDKVKLTWERKKEGRWYIASQKYPEIHSVGNPFSIKNNIESWKSVLEERQNFDINYINKHKQYDLDKPEDKEVYEIKVSVAKKHWSRIENTMNLLTQDAKDAIVNNHLKVVNTYLKSLKIYNEKEHDD